MIRVGILVNSVEDLKANQSTVRIARACVEREWEGWIMGVRDVNWSEDLGPFASARSLISSRSAESFLKRLDQSEPKQLSWSELDLLLLRTNPARDQKSRLEHRLSLSCARMAQESGVLVINDPTGLALAGDKSYLYRLPVSVRPRSCISGRPEILREFSESIQGPIVLKPLRGTHGESVLMVEESSQARRPFATHSLNEALRVFKGRGPVLAQEYLPEATQGDIRLLVLNGLPLEIEGKMAAVRRVPPLEDFRSNVHLGGIPETVANVASLRLIVQEISQQLVADGLLLVGLDIVGNKIIEVNVHSPGGLPDAEAFYRRDFVGEILKVLENRLNE